VIEGSAVLEKMNHLSVDDEGTFSSVPTPAIVIERIRTDS